MQRFIWFCLALLVATCGYGQNYVDLFKFTYLNSPINRYDTLNEPARVQEFYADATLPIKLSDRLVVLTGFTAEQLSVKTIPVGFNVNSVFATTLKVGVNYEHSKKWDGTYMFLPKISSDFDNVQSNQMQLGGLILYKYHKKENFKYRLGLYYNTEAFGPFFVPLLGFYYLSKNKKFEANFTLPVWADMNYRFKPWFATGVNFSAFVRSYYLSPSSNTANKEMYLVKASNELYGYLQFTAKKSFIFQFKGGYSIGRRFSSYDWGEQVKWGFSAFRFGDQRKETESNIKDGLIFQARFIYRFNLDKDVEPKNGVN
jgi:hypothetical protein